MFNLVTERGKNNALSMVTEVYCFEINSPNFYNVTIVYYILRHVKAPEQTLLSGRIG